MMRMVMLRFVMVMFCWLLLSQQSVAADLTIYDDALASGWADWSWGSSRNLAAPSPVQMVALGGVAVQ